MVTKVTTGEQRQQAALRRRSISSRTSKASQYEQLAEECMELASVCMKMARKFRGESPTPESFIDIRKQIIEEYTDVRLVSDVCDIKLDMDLMVNKTNRWYERLINQEQTC